MQTREYHLEECPTEIFSPDPDKMLTLGDLDGGACTLLNVLISNAIIYMHPENYQRYYSIYKNDDDGTHPIDIYDFTELNQLLATIKKPNHNIRIQLIGDEVCDRTGNDILMLLNLQCLDSLKIPISIILSNHSLEFLEQFTHDLSDKIQRDEQKRNDPENEEMEWLGLNKLLHPKVPDISNTISFQNQYEMFGKSMHKARQTLNNEVIRIDDYIDLVINHYLTKLIFMNYVETQDILFAHAPQSESMLLELAKIFHIENASLKTPADKMDFITQVNNQFKSKILALIECQDQNTLNEIQLFLRKLRPFTETRHDKLIDSLHSNSSLRFFSGIGSELIGSISPLSSTNGSKCTLVHGHTHGSGDQLPALDQQLLDSSSFSYQDIDSKSDSTTCVTLKTYLSDQPLAYRLIEDYKPR